MMTSTVNTNGIRRIAVAISGGVDSSVAAYLLKRSASNHNHELMGLHMSNWNTLDEDSHGNFCEQSERDARDANDVCDSLGIEMHKVEFISEYWNGVFEPFVNALENQRMMNPDVGCNSIVKFGAMREYSMNKLGCDYIATGHYARLWHRNKVESEDNDILMSINRSLIEEHVVDLPEEEWIFSWGNDDKSCDAAPLLLSGADLTKDQSYFLCGVKGSSLSNFIFPLGELQKKNQRDILCSSDNHIGDIHNENWTEMSVRDIARSAKLPTASKKESMGICFIGKRNFSEFISQYLPHEPEPGNFIDIDTGEIVGKHKGSTHYTIGQGAKISGASRKWFISKKDMEGNIFVCDNTHHPSLYSNELYIQENDFNWIAGELPLPIREGKSIPAQCRTRHLQPLIPCIVSLEDSFVQIKFDRPIRSITPGQAAVLYVGNGLICVGGGQIWTHGPTYHDLGVDLPITLHPAGNNDTSVNQRTNKI